MTATCEPQASPRTHLLSAVSCAAIACVVASSWAGVAHAQTTLTWGISGSAATGSWTSSGTNWWNGTTNVAWANNSIAWIGGSTQNTITVSGFTPTVSGITFSPTANQTISGGAIALGNAATPITSLNNTNTITSQLTGNGMGITTRGNVYLSGSNSYTGSTVLTGGILQLQTANGSIVNSQSLTVAGNGTFILDLTNLNLDRLGDSMPVNMEGGTFRNGNTSPGNWSETTGTLKVNAGPNNILTVRAGSGTTSTLTFTGLERSSGATMQFGASGSYVGLGVDSRNRILFTTAPTLSNGIIGGWALHGDTAGLNWATYDATNGVQALSSYQTGTESSWVSTDNVRVTAAQTLSANRSINSLLISNTATGVSIGIPTGRTLTVGSGGVLLTGNNTNGFAIGTSGGGSLTAGSSGPADLVLYQTTTARTDFYPAVVDNGSANGAVSFVKNGSGYILWWTQSSYSGDTVINQGAITTRGNNFLPSGSGKGNVVVRSAGTLDLYGNNQAVNGLSGDGIVTLTTNGTSTLTVGANDASSVFSGSLNNGSAAGRVLAFTKTGTGSLSLTGLSTFTGTAAVQNGVVRFNSVASSTNAQALGGGSVVTIGLAATSSGEIDYTGSTGTFDKNVFALGNGRNRIRNSGGGALTLSGTLTKNGTILELAGGTFTVSGQITGASANSDLYVNGASVTLTNTNNDYNGPTYVYGGGTLTLGNSQVIPSGSILTLGATGGGDTGTGILVVGSLFDSVGGLRFGSAGGAVRMTASGTAGSAQLTAPTGTIALAGGTLDLTGSGTTSGLYRLFSAQSVTGSFASITGTSAAYQVVTTPTSVNYQQRAVLGSVSVTNPAAAIITGGSAAFTYTVANNALSGGADLGFSSGSLSNLAGSSSGTAAGGGSSGATSGLMFTGTSIGNSQQGTFTVTAPDAFGVTTATGTVSVTVLDHATSSLAGSLLTSTTVSLGTYNYATNTWESGGATGFFDIHNIASSFGAGLTADLSLLGVTGAANGFTTNLLSTYADIAGGNSQQFSIAFDPTGLNTSTTRSTMFTITTSDKTGMAGATASNTLYVTASVIAVPEPGALALAGIGVAAAAWAVRRRK